MKSKQKKIKRIETSRLTRNRRNLTSLMENKRKNASLLLAEKNQQAGKKLPLKRESQPRKNPPRKKRNLWLPTMKMIRKIRILKRKIGKGDIWLRKKLNGKHVEYN